MNETIRRKKVAHKAVCQNSTEENKRSYESMKNNAKKAVSKATERRLKRRVLNKKLSIWDVLASKRTNDW